MQYKRYFQSLIDELNRLGFTGRRTGPSTNWCRFSSRNRFCPEGIKGISYGAQFAEEDRVLAHIHIHEDARVNRLELFYALKHRKEEIEFEFGSQLDWQRRPSKSLYARSRIVVSRDGNIELPDAELECIRLWHIVNLLKLKKVFEPKIKEEIENLLSIES